MKIVRLIFIGRDKVVILDLVNMKMYTEDEWVNMVLSEMYKKVTFGGNVDLHPIKDDNIITQASQRFRDSEYMPMNLKNVLSLRF